MKNIKYSKFLWAFIIVFLIVGCGGSDEKTTEDRGIEENSFQGGATPNIGTEGNGSQSGATPNIGTEGNSSQSGATPNIGTEGNSSQSGATPNIGTEGNSSQGGATPNIGTEGNSSQSGATQNTESEESPSASVSNGEQTLHGNWINIESGVSEKIDKNYTYPIKRLGDNFIEVTKENSEKHILLRDGSPDGVVRGQLYSDIEHLQKFDMKRGEEITIYKPILKKSKKYKVVIDDGFNQQSKIVSANGNFSFSGVTTGTLTKISIIDIEEVLESDPITEDSNNSIENVNVVEEIEHNQTVFETEMPIVDEDTDLGNFPIPDEETKYNFKTTNVIDTQDKDDRYMYESRTFKGKLTFVNSGTEMATALNYEIKTDDPYVEELTHEVVMGSVEANASVDISFKVTFRRLDKIAHRVKLDFLIRDVNRKEWLDHVYLDVYQTPVMVNLKTKTSNLKGYFITPEHEIISMDTKNIKVKIPSRPDASYYFLVVSPKNIGAETAYSMGIDVNSSDFDDFHDTSAFEPNNLEESATKLEVGDSIKSFIHKGDIDFYTIDFKQNTSYEPPRLPFN